uniref:Uncharacterized protein n=1 Tax=Arundo donax TaxID=35708 RepID=A0A0A8ZKP7_ARUDO
MNIRSTSWYETVEEDVLLWGLHVTNFYILAS